MRVGTRTPPRGTPTIRRFGPPDAEALVRHAASVGYRYAAEDWMSFFNTGVVIGHADGTEIVSSAAVSKLGGSLGWLGAFIVNPVWKGRGLGRSLLAECLRLNP